MLVLKPARTVPTQTPRILPVACLVQLARLAPQDQQFALLAKITVTSNPLRLVIQPARMANILKYPPTFVRYVILNVPNVSAQRPLNAQNAKSAVESRTIC